MWGVRKDKVSDKVNETREDKTPCKARKGLVWERRKAQSKEADWSRHGTPNLVSKSVAGLLLA